MPVVKMPLPELRGIDELRQVEARLREVCKGDSKWTDTFSSVLQGGKRLRPALVILCGSFLPSPRNELVDVAVASELIHAASLIHDDVIDHAETRRGIPTISSQYGEHRAVLYGDFLFARAFSLLTEHGHTAILANMTRAISLMCEGEIEQASMRYDCSISESAYMSYVHKKTAFLLSACCLAGAGVCGLTPLLQRHLAAFGLYLGYAFQVTDDLLDYCGDANQTGKPVLHDLREGYLTLPVIRLLQTPEYGPRLRRIITERDFSDENLSFVQHSLTEAGILSDVRSKARLLLARAKLNLSRLPNRNERTILFRLADQVLNRQS